MLRKVKSFFLRLKEQKQCKEQKTPSYPRTNICKICFENIEDSSLHSLLSDNTCICHKCFNKFQPKFHKFKVDGYKALALFDYDDEVKEKLYQFKGCFDYELGQVFLNYFLPYLKLKYLGYYLVPAPSHFSHDKARGFNHVEVIFSSLKMKMIKCIHKTSDVKQSDLNAKERQNIHKHLIIENGEQIRDKKILIVDDVFTTGSTIKSMIKLIEKYKPKKIQILLLSKTINPRERN